MAAIQFSKLTLIVVVSLSIGGIQQPKRIQASRPRRYRSPYLELLDCPDLSTRRSRPVPYSFR